MFIIYFPVHMVGMAVEAVDTEEVTEDDRETLVHTAEVVIEAVTVVAGMEVTEGRTFHQ